MTSTALALSDKINYSQQLSLADMLPAAYRRKPANVLLAMEYGDAFGFAPVQAMTLIHVIDGKPSMSAQGIGGLVRRAGHRFRVWFDNERQVAVATVVRADDPDFEFRSEWSHARAQAAGLTNKQVWKAYPINMLKARATTEVARDACPEILFGAGYTAEELGRDEGVDQDGGLIVATIDGQDDTTDPGVARTAHHAFLDACMKNEIDPDECFAIVGADEVTNENAQAFRDAIKTILAARAGSQNVETGSPVHERGEGEAASTLAGAVVDVDVELTDKAAPPSPQYAPSEPSISSTDGFPSEWMVPECTDDALTVTLSKEQRITMMALSSEVFGQDRDARMAWAGDVTGRLVTTFNELTEWEADHMIGRLREMRGEK